VRGKGTKLGEGEKGLRGGKGLSKLILKISGILRSGILRQSRFGKITFEIVTFGIITWCCFYVAKKLACVIGRKFLSSLVSLSAFGINLRYDL
jgi:hypothetical protein